MVKRHVLTSYKVNDITKRATCDDNGTVILMAQGAKREFTLHFAT